MKKTLIIAALLASLGGCLQAQDTVWQKPWPLDNYFYNSWQLDTTRSYDGVVTRHGNSFAFAKQFITKDPLQVYGIAAMLMNEKDELKMLGDSDSTIQALFNQWYPDSSLDNCEESLLLFQYLGSNPMPMQQLGDSLHVQTLHTPVSYYMMSNTPPISFLDALFSPFPKPVYERYFQTPQTVHDTFYTGLTQSELYFSLEDSLLHTARPYFGCNCFGPPGDTMSKPVSLATLSQGEFEDPRTWHFIDRRTCEYFLFPILTPDPSADTTAPVNPGDTISPINPGDTISPGDTTAAVPSVNLLNRYVSLSPNPASGKVSVVSSFGLSRIEAFDAQGRLVYNTTCPPPSPPPSTSPPGPAAPTSSASTPPPAPPPRNSSSSNRPTPSPHTPTPPFGKASLEPCSPPRRGDG